MFLSYFSRETTVGPWNFFIEELLKEPNASIDDDHIANVLRGGIQPTYGNFSERLKLNNLCLEILFSIFLIVSLRKLVIPIQLKGQLITLRLFQLLNIIS